MLRDDIETAKPNKSQVSFHLYISQAPKTFRVYVCGSELRVPGVVSTRLSGIFFIVLLVVVGGFWRRRKVLLMFFFFGFFGFDIFSHTGLPPPTPAQRAIVAPLLTCLPRENECNSSGMMMMTTKKRSMKMLLNSVMELASVCMCESEKRENYDFSFIFCFHNYTPSRPSSVVELQRRAKVQRDGVRRLMTHSFNGLVRSFEGSFTHMLRRHERAPL